MRNEDENLSCMKQNLKLKLNPFTINPDRNNKLRQTDICILKAGFRVFDEFSIIKGFPNRNIRKTV
jgi:hypothetical protein